MLCPNCKETEMTEIEDLFLDQFPEVDEVNRSGIHHCGECGTLATQASYYAPRRFEIAKTAPLTEEAKPITETTED